MNKLRKILFLLSLPIIALAQTNTLTTTTFSSAVAGGGAVPPPQYVTVASSTGINVPSITSGNQGTLLFTWGGEAMRVIAQVASTTTYQVLRGQNGTQAMAHLSGELIFIGNPDWFGNRHSGEEPIGGCTKANLYTFPNIEVIPNKWLTCDSTGTWAYAGPGIGDGRIPIARTTIADAAYTVLPWDYIVAYTSLTAGRTVTLPAAASMPKKVYIIVDEAGAAGSHTITVTTANGCASITANYGSCRVYSNGTAWQAF